ncbi:MAG: hypothetical protein Q7K43_06270, partial [Candidatus Woesearchaeota archaeon]|nr:hypothetical protein [Candidatus Woesearchaeota archaeon]
SQEQYLAFIANISVSTTKHELFEITQLVICDSGATPEDLAERTIGLVAKGMQIQTHIILLESLRCGR